MFARLSLTFLFVLGSVQAGTISVSPASTSVTVGQSFGVTVNVNSIIDLYAYQFDLSFNPAVLQATSITEGSFLDEGGTAATLFFGGTVDNVGGTVTTNADSLETAVTGVSGSGILVAFQFRAIAAGSSQDEISNVFLLDSNLESIDAGIANGTVNVVATPEPSCALLVALGLGALFVRSRSCLSRW